MAWQPKVYAESRTMFSRKRSDPMVIPNPVGKPPGKNARNVSYQRNATNIIDA
jgi:hypothetical protein